jgi:hypothetical protein
VEQTANKLQLMVDDATALGRYSNLAVVSANDTEFVLDFAFVQPGTRAAKVHSRVVLSPAHAKMLQRLLAARIKDVESRIGAIRVPSSSQQVTH